MRGSISDLVLRAGVAFAFIYPPINAWTDPNAWIGYFPQFMQGIVPSETLLHTFGVIEIVLALWILSGWKIFFPSLLAALMLLAIVVFNSNEFQVLFRDIAIAAAAIALAIMHRPHAKIQNP